MKISMCIMILPRLEVFFLEEFIEHHLMLGVDKVYIYDNGTRVVENKWRRGKMWIPRRLSSEERGVKWAKKPEADYFLDYTDEQIYDKLNEVVEKFPNQVELRSWIRGKDHNSRHPSQQNRAYQNCIENNKSDWWLLIDPDEYIVLKEHDDLRGLMTKYPETTCFRFYSRIFEERKRDVPVRSIFNWGYDFKRNFKPLVINKIKRYHIHSITPEPNVTTHLPRNTAVYHHYRGSPSTMGGSAHYHRRQRKFDKYDDTMKKYLK